ncbi:MAG TPA: hypothetical protein PLO69_10985 [Gammaproteobacteria bacterium]|nr:hypothetical protein [Gammaproteobacteria bacterium]
MPAVNQLLADPANVADRLSFATKAPRRQLMTKTWGAFDPSYTTYAAGQIYTFQYVMPLEGNPYAFRIGVSDPFAGEFQITSAAVYMSDSYSGWVQAGVPVEGNLMNITTIPTANSVWLTCTLTNGSATVTCPSTASIPTATGTVYAIGPYNAGLPVNATATVPNGTTAVLSGNFTGVTGTYTVQFANMATECRIYWDNAGANVDTINTAGINRSITLTGNPVNVGAGAYPYTISWSDLAPCAGVSRADSGNQYLAFVYLTIGASTTSYGYNSPTVNFSRGAGVGPDANLGFDSLVTGPVLNGRYYFIGRPWANGGTDFADNPGGSGFTPPTISPSLAIQYLTDTPGWNVLQVGDSISTAPPNDGFTTPVMRACYLLSTPQAPCEWSSVAWGGQASPVYDEALRNNLLALNPSAIVGQPISRNDGLTLPILQMLMAKLSSYAEKADARIGLYGAFPFTTTLDGNPSLQTIVATMRSRLAAISKTCQPASGSQTCPMIPVLDPVPVVSRAALGGNFWDYLGTGVTASGATVAGATSIPINSNGNSPCQIGDILTDDTTPAAIAAGSTVSASSAGTLTVTASVVIGSGVQPGDVLVCSMPGWNGGALSFDNTHPWYPAALLLQPAANTFMQQLLGLQ